ncbi:MAG: helix-turn-helix transcriptional regulator [Oscillospiraceae bacterium]|nr:helix-turn-helix transcriptional regulator [Oscillospiraceae bacterium]
MREYHSYQVKKEVTVQSLVTIEMLDISSGFSYPEETHEFYELAYVDSGTILCNRNEEITELQQGDFLLIPPLQPHAYSTASNQTATLFVICFCGRSEYLSILDEKITLNQDAKHIVSQIIVEAKNAFVFPFEKKLKLLSKPTIGAQQMVCNELEKLLIHLIRARVSKNREIVFMMSSMELEHSLSNDIYNLLKAHLYDNITLEEISQQTYYSKTFLNGIFKKSIGLPIMKYYTMMKIHEAKRLLRGNMTVADVAAQLSFESSTYFTKVFKKYVHMTPTEYKKTLM